MKLCESPDFRDAIRAAGQHFANLGLTEAFIEKDYYVTEALRIVATQRPTQVIFKGGTYPVETVLLDSYLAEFLRFIGNSLNAEDEASFPMTLLHFRRTFVEKLFAIHAKVKQCQREATSLGSAARHYYDLFCLAQTPEVQQMLASEEYSDIKQNSAFLSQQEFPQQYEPPENLAFSNSIALFPAGELRQRIAKEYRQQCQNLCYGNYPTWEEVEAGFWELRDRL